jgi:hypothetical protein
MNQLMNRNTASLGWRKACVCALVATALALTATAARSQQKQLVSYSIPPGASKFTQEHLIDVGDAPGHKVRVFESRIDYDNINLTFGGVRVKESFTRGTSDYTNGTGTSSNYAVYVLEDGNRVFSRESGVGQATQGADGSISLRYAVVGTLIGGTGKFRGIKGQLRGNVVRIPGEQSIKADVAGEYWIDE